MIIPMKNKEIELSLNVKCKGEITEGERLGNSGRS